MTILKVHGNDGKLLYQQTTFDTTIEYIFYTQFEWGVTLTLPRQGNSTKVDHAVEILKSLMLILTTHNK